MLLSHLRIGDFRNLAFIDIQPGPWFNVVCGPNGQGKTNLLEAIYLLSAVKSFRPQKNKELIRWGQPEARVEGLIERAGQQRQATIDISPQGKRVSLNGSPVQRLNDFFGSLNAIVFAPDDLSIIKGGPTERRQFLDRAIFNLSAGFLIDAVAYRKILHQRNAALKSSDRRGGRLLLDVYDEQLASLGAILARRRLQYVSLFAPRFIDTFKAIFGGQQQGDHDADLHIPEVSVSYHAPWRQDHDDDQDALQQQLAMALAASRNDDFRRGFTTRGPHRDDLTLTMNGRPFRAFASQGQQRAAVLAMKIAEVSLFQDQRGFRPILLLDDVSSELDRTRNRFLFQFLCQEPGQVFISTTHRDHILLEQDVVTFNVNAGDVSAQR